MSAFKALQRRSSAPGAGGAILALDLGTTTGYAIAARDCAIASGAVSFKPSRYDGGGIRYLRFRSLAGRDHCRRCGGIGVDPLRRGAPVTPAPTPHMFMAACSQR